MHTHIVIIGHGRFATGCQSTIELIAGIQPNIDYLDFGIDGETVSLYDRIAVILKAQKDKSLLFICDILGGTPFKTAVELTYEMEHVSVVAGPNISAMIEVVLQKDMVPFSELAQMLITETQQTVIQFTKAPVVIQESVASSDGGI